MGFRAYLAERAGNPLEWRSADKSLFMLSTVWLLNAGYLAWAALVLAWPLGSELVREQHVLPHLPGLAWLLTGTTALMAATWLNRRSSGESLWHQHLGAQWYTLSLIVLSHFTGVFTLATGVILSGAAVVGFMFLNRAVVFAAMTNAIVLHVGLTLASVHGVVPHGDMLGPTHDPDGSLAGFWAGSIYAFTAPQYIVLVALSYYILTRWRQREAEVRLLSMTDALTGVANRRSIMALLQRELEKSRETGLPVTVIMVDLDHFKQLNDTWGHQTGDRVLKAAAGVFRQSLRQSDHVGRYGGEEFLIILPGADNHGASLLAERCRAALAALRVAADDGDNTADKTVSVTASFGLCSTDKRGNEMSQEQLLRTADDALYLAKDQGRNRVEVACP